MANGEGRRRPLLLSAFCLLLLVSAIRLASTYRVFSQTADEPVHVDCGLRWLTRGDLDCDPEHPPLARIAFAAVPFLQGENEVLEPGPRYRHDLFVTRAGNLIFFFAALAVIEIWATRLFGPAAGVVAAGLFASLPPVLAHAGLATTDMAACATVAGAALALTLWLEDPSIARSVLLGIAVAAGICAKYSFIVYFPIAATALLIAMRRRPAVLRLLLVAAIALIGVWSVFRFSSGTLNSLWLEVDPPGDPHHVAAQYARVPGYAWVSPGIIRRYWRYGHADFVDWAKASGYPSPLAGRHGNTMAGAPPLEPLGFGARVEEPFRAVMAWCSERLPLPAPALWKGIIKVARHNEAGHKTYLFGHVTRLGWWFYFPVVLFFKTPVAFIALTAAGIGMIGMTLRGEALAVAIAPLLMLVPPMFSHINLGVRHVLPLYPFFAIAASFAAVELWRRGGRQTAGVAAAVAWLVIASTLAHPDYLAYFNEAALGHGERIVVDSNLDWGQDLLRLASVVRQLKLQHLYIAYFGSADSSRFVPCAVEDLSPGHPVTGWIAVSETELAMENFEWLKACRPEREVGKSIRLYRVLH